MQSSEESTAVSNTADFLRKAEHLRKLVDKHEKERATNKHKRRNGLRDCCCVLEEFENKLNLELKAETLRVHQQLQKIRNGVYRFQGQLMDVKPSSNLIEKLKDIMSEIEHSINTFKEQQHKSFEELLHEERTCWQEISAFERKIDSWTLVVKKDSEFSIFQKTKHGMATKTRQEFPVDVMALETFLQQTGGKLGGWDQYDHQSFLKVWTKHCGKPSYRSEVKLYLPGKTEEEIRLHEDWYLEMCRLQEKKKEAIQKWRSERQREREARVQHEHQAVRKEQEVTLAEAQRREQEEERREAALRLETWRKQRKDKQEQEKEQRLREEVLRSKRLKEERRRQQEVKLAVEAHIRERKEEEERRMMEKEEQERAELEEKRRLAAEGIKRFQERDLHKLETKLQERQAKEEEQVERLKKQAKMKEKVLKVTLAEILQDSGNQPKDGKNATKRLGQQEVDLFITCFIGQSRHGDKIFKPVCRLHSTS
ncbi:hypothetical protein QTP86_015033, partial [Hemibagrus guttatus]